MKRAGFTMIELIFVIVILGILSAVALPKFIGVSEQAKAGKCKAYVGTLNRTVLPAIWSDMVLNDGNVTAYFNEGNITAQITPPSDCGSNTDYAAAAAAGTGFTVLVGATNYDVNGTKATADVSPIISWSKQP